MFERHDPGEGLVSVGQRQRRTIFNRPQHSIKLKSHLVGGNRLRMVSGLPLFHNVQYYVTVGFRQATANISSALTSEIQQKQTEIGLFFSITSVTSCSFSGPGCQVTTPEKSARVL